MYAPDHSQSGDGHIDIGTDITISQRAVLRRPRLSRLSTLCNCRVPISRVVSLRPRPVVVAHRASTGRSVEREWETGPDSVSDSAIAFRTDARGGGTGTPTRLCLSIHIIANCGWLRWGPRGAP
jgi:hypothetical protein